MATCVWVLMLAVMFWKVGGFYGYEESVCYSLSHSMTFARNSVVIFALNDSFRSPRVVSINWKHATVTSPVIW